MGAYVTTASALPCEAPVGDALQQLVDSWINEEPSSTDVDRPNDSQPEQNLSERRNQHFLQRQSLLRQLQPLATLLEPDIRSGVKDSLARTAIDNAVLPGIPVQSVEHTQSIQVLAVGDLTQQRKKYRQHPKPKSKVTTFLLSS